MKEHELIGELSRILGEQPGEIVPSGLGVGIGDDCALITPPPGYDLLATTDSQREGVHFRWEWIDPRSVGRRLVAVNVSDVASKGGRPAFALVAAGIPAGFSPETIKEIYRGLAEESRRYGMAIAGGDVSRNPGGMSLVMTLLGWVSSGAFVGRRGLVPGDLLYLVGRPGRARAGYLSLERKRTDPHFGGAWEAFRTPRALLREGGLLAVHPGVKAMTDTSDGLGRSLAELARASSVTMRVDDIPVTREVRDWAEALREDPRELVWTGGEDYDLLVGVDAPSEESFLMWAKNELLRISPEGVFRIGQVEPRGDADFFFGEGVGSQDWGGGFEHTE